MQKSMQGFSRRLIYHMKLVFVNQMRRHLRYVLEDQGLNPNEHSFMMTCRSNVAAARLGIQAIQLKSIHDLEEI